MTPVPGSIRSGAEPPRDPDERSPGRRPRFRPPRLLGDVHEVIERELDRIRERPGPGSRDLWERDRRRLGRLLTVERRLLGALARERTLAPMASLLDPRQQAQRVELEALLTEAAARAARHQPWPDVVRDLAEFLAWSFIAVERAAAGD